MRAYPVLIVALLGLAACGDPLEQVPRLSDVERSEEAAQVEALAPEAPEALAEAPAPAVAEDKAPRRGLLGFLRGRAEAASEQEDAGAAVPEAAPELVESVEGADVLAEEGPPEAVLAAAPPPEPKPDAEPRGLFGGLFGGGRGADSGAQDETAAAPPAPETPRRRATRGPRPGAPDYEQVGPGVTLPYGKVARLCGTPANRLGKKAGQYPERGGKYKLYDSAPGSTGLRSFFLTGFDDGCARQFSAALVIFGTPEIYEQIRYGAPSKTQPVAETDQAYEQVKSRVCRSGRGKPCGSRMSQLARDTVFVSIYERFGSNARWKNLLLHDGEVLALDIKSR